MYHGVLICSAIYQINSTLPPFTSIFNLTKCCFFKRFTSGRGLLGCDTV